MSDNRHLPVVEEKRTKNERLCDDLKNVPLKGRADHSSIKSLFNIHYYATMIDFRSVYRFIEAMAF